MVQRILVIDDEAHIVQVLSLKLRNAGYEVLTASDGEEGLEVVAAESSANRVIDLIITDFQMPYMTGLELCKALSKNQKWSKIPVLVLTARGYALEADDLAIASADGRPMIRNVLTKPFSPRAIVEHIQGILDEGKGESLSAGMGASGSVRAGAGGALMRNAAAERNEAA